MIIIIMIVVIVALVRIIINYIVECCFKNDYIVNISVGKKTTRCRYDDDDDDDDYNDYNDDDDDDDSTREIDDDEGDLMLMLDITSESVEYMVVKTVYGQRSEVHLNRVGEFWLNGRIEEVRRS